MGIDEKEVAKVARLARLILSAEEARLYPAQLGRVLDHMEELKRLDTEAVTPTTHVLELTNVLREDEERPFPGREELLANAPEREGSYFKVPKVIE